MEGVNTGERERGGRGKKNECRATAGKDETGSRSWMNRGAKTSWGLWDTVWSNKTSRHDKRASGRGEGTRANEGNKWRTGKDDDRRRIGKTSVFMCVRKKVLREDGKMRMEWEGKQWGKIETWKGSGAAEINSLWGSQDRGSGVQMLHYKYSVGYGRNSGHQFALDVQWKTPSSLPFRAFPTWREPLLTRRRYGQQSLTRLASGVFHTRHFPPATASSGAGEKCSSIRRRVFRVVFASCEVEGFMSSRLFVWRVKAWLCLKQSSSCKEIWFYTCKVTEIGVLRMQKEREVRVLPSFFHLHNWPMAVWSYETQDSEVSWGEVGFRCCL